MGKTKLLVVTRHSPLPENDGAGAYLFDLLDYLARHGVEIEIAWIKAEGPFVSKGWWRVPRHLSAIADVRIIGSLPMGRFRCFWWGPLEAEILGAIKTALVRVGLWRNRPTVEAPAGTVDVVPASIPLPASDEPKWSELPSRLETRFFRRRVQRFNPDAILANYCWLTPLLPADGRIKGLVLTHDVASHRFALKDAPAHQQVRDFSPATPEGEARLLDRADVVLAISQDDAAVFSKMVPREKIRTAPKSAPTRSHHSKPISGRCLFVGGVNPPNREGLGWFISQVWPLVLAKRPDATLHVCGAIGQTVSTPAAGVVLRGRVEKLDTEYAAAEVVVVPLLQGTGIKIKLVEACSFGKACVTTPVGLQGLPFLRETVIEVVEPAEFAEGILRILLNPGLRDDLGRRTLEAVTLHLSPDRCYEPVLEALN